MLLLTTNQACLQTRRGVDFICFICTRPGDSCHVTTTATNTPPRKRFSFLLYTILIFLWLCRLHNRPLFYLFNIYYTNVQLSRLWMCEVTMTKGLRRVSILSPWLLLHSSIYTNVCLSQQWWKGLEMHQSLVCVLYI